MVCWMFCQAIPPTRLASPSAFPSLDPSFPMFFALTMSKIFHLTIVVVSCLAMVAAAPLTSDSGSDLVKRVTHEGRGTWFWPGMGNCGWNNGENDKIVAISKSRYDAEHASNCGQWMEITNLANGRTVLAQTVDSCPGCGYDDLDMSPAAFKALADLSEGQLRVKWHFESKSFHP